MEEELRTPKLSAKKTTKWKSYLQQPTKPLHFKPNFESIQKFNSNHKVKQKTEQESKADFQTNRNSETKEDVSLRDSCIQTPEIIGKSKPDIFLTESAGFSAFWSKVLTSLRFKTNTLNNWKSISYEKKERLLSQTALQNKDQVFCICRKTCNISKENWIFVMKMCIYIMNIHVVLFVMNSIIIAALASSLF